MMSLPINICYTMLSSQLDEFHQILNFNILGEILLTAETDVIILAAYRKMPCRLDRHVARSLAETLYPNYE